MYEKKNKTWHDVSLRYHWNMNTQPMWGSGVGAENASVDEEMEQLELTNITGVINQ